MPCRSPVQFSRLRSPLLPREPVGSYFSPRRAALAGIPGFSLVELLVTMAIIGILMGLSTMAITHLAKAATLTTAGSELINLANLARQNSMSRNAMTALIILDDPALENHRRAFTLLEITPPADGSRPGTDSWKQISNWRTLPPGVIIEFSDEFPTPVNFPFQIYPSTRPDPDFPVLEYQGKEAGSFRYVAFLPLGGLKQSHSAIVRLAEGFFPPNAASPVYTRPNADGRAANYYDVSILPATGRTKIDRP